MSDVSAEHADWTREQCRRGEWNPGKALLRSIRDYQKNPKSLRARIAVFRHRFWSAVSGADIPLNCRIAGGLLIPHPNGIVIHPDAIIGPNCLIFQQVTVGTAGQGAPVIGGHVDIGAGAKVLGQIAIGNHARIGANAVVIKHVPEAATAVGNPMRIIERTKS